MTRRKSPNVYHKPRKSRGTRPVNRKKSPLRRVLETLAIFVCVISVLCGGLWYYIAYAPAIPEETVLYVPSKASYRQVCDSLRASGFVNDYRFDLLAKIRKYPYYVKPGRYILPEGASTSSVVDKLRSGAQDEVHLHFGRMRSLSGLATTVGHQIEADSTALMALFTQPARLAAFSLFGAPLTYETALGCFMPNTYYIHWNTTPEKFLSRMIYEQ
ncbi:MAG: endolytic transglycosylase MltG, partial [Bacteroidales bacterium]|nr:endolytic transglycosylase MltG [Bacteroidales bacterium]